MGTSEKSKGGNKVIVILLIFLIVCMLAVIGVLAYMVLKPKETSEPAESKVGSLLIDESNLEEVKEEVSEKTAEGMFEVNMNVDWHFPDGTSASTDAVVMNGSANTYPISFDIILNDEVIYASTVIPVGKQIKDIILEKDLDAGTYNAVCKYHLWKEDGTELSQFAVNVKLTIKQ